MQRAFETASIFADVRLRHGSTIPATRRCCSFGKCFPIVLSAFGSAECQAKLDWKMRKRQEFHRYGGPKYRHLPKYWIFS
jgi:hypothetical protein